MTRTHAALLLLLAALLGACSWTDPYERDGVWHPNGANEANLRAMVMVPSDLVMAAPAAPAAGQEAAAALDRQRRDKVRPLPESGVAKLSPVSSSGQTAGAGN